MRKLIIGVSLLLAACAAPSSRAPVTTMTLTSADASTSLSVGERLFFDRQSQAAGEGMDPVVNVTLRHDDGRRLVFQEANHTPNDLFVQRVGGPLAQVMGLGETDAPTLYHAASGEGQSGAPFLCGPQGPAAIGVFESADGGVRVVGLRQPFQVETLANGESNALPYSPDQVCARLNFRRG